MVMSSTGTMYSQPVIPACNAMEGPVYFTIDLPINYPSSTTDTSSSSPSEEEVRLRVAVIFHQEERIVLPLYNESTEVLNPRHSYIMHALAYTDTRTRIHRLAYTLLYTHALMLRTCTCNGKNCMCDKWWTKVSK